ncbi:MAG: bifunctional diaminohydroxyphosphoribosylaminopyrimidine deaminase/5-amino-6-(5-phosphoribosylamino)uracil reductase RibD [Myxococcota bacterium]|nr:bifunctional diaminohydroxyphosphoribosylaminopyrimidine deaminase/5-amino-6-(5-phosphoribosylamino)uracil reductase RibD [Myxococcota bacterium]
MKSKTSTNVSESADLAERDITHMRRAIALASQAIGRTAPNPPVGCVLVKNGRVIGEGYHRKAGLPHAERDALANALNDTKGATAYVTLEPCNHHGRTPPCTDALLEAGIQRVVVGAVDPNPRVSGAGLERLRVAGVEVVAGVCEHQALELIAPFTRHMLHRRPLVTIKIACTLDGKIATSSGHSQWITGPEARLDVHRLRNHVDAIAVGAGTVRTDNPRLTTRLPDDSGRSPLRVIVSTRLNLPMDAQIFDAELASNTVIFCAETNPRVEASFAKKGVEVIPVGHGSGEGVALDIMLDMLARRDVMWLMVEGGTGLSSSFLQQGLVDTLRIYQAPKVIGADGLSWAGAMGLRTMEDVQAWSLKQVQQLGSDIRIDLQRT